MTRVLAISLPWIILALWFCIALALLVPWAWSAHGSGHWIEGYRNAEGQSCCGALDCRRVYARLIAQTGTQTTAGVRSEMTEDETIIHLPPGSVHISEDASDYACVVPSTAEVSDVTVRCLFIAPSM